MKTVDGGFFRYDFILTKRLLGTFGGHICRFARDWTCFVLSSHIKKGGIRAEML